ncbi:TIGR01244 family sulfur transferase [Falsigemmobacter faecalis]|uniref:TIGR01244 family phosphatase n=1 Tax=Falsigemmobacter faecalis TaxID=2488730 RepID=A0A3P3DUH4_9RHOB|nr:TIGR01244 family sulfur transferase [Falsigemmobacter faecalis]RRH76368.1 TIGR01244 family phosphatase [Falsigemmobacter faecalis]
MTIREITDNYSVSPQIALEDLPQIAEAGYSLIIDNRPDGEIPSEIGTEAMRAAAEAAGLTFVANPVIGGAITMENVSTQGAAISGAAGRILAYCASGNRSSIVWALSQAGNRPTDELVALPARHGYNMEIWRDQIEALASGK